jgi:protein-disulfide isomerase
VARPEPKSRGTSLTPFYVILGVVAVAGAVLLYTQMRGAAGAPATGPQAIDLTAEEVRAAPGITAGPADAPVVILEFGDFQCGACQQFATFSKPLLNDFIQDGSVRFVWYDFPLIQIHRNAFLAARAGRCANDQNAFWTYHDVVFGRIGEWQDAPSPAPRFVDYAAQAGLDRGAFEQCLNSDRFQREVTENMRLGESLGVQGTPTIFVNGQRLTEWPRTRAQWEELIQAARGSAPAPAGEAHADDPAGDAA